MENTRRSFLKKVSAAGIGAAGLAARLETSRRLAGK